jgi:Zinc knuckle
MLADEIATAKSRADAQALERELRYANRSLAKSSSDTLTAPTSGTTSRSAAPMEDHQLRNIVDSIPTFSGEHTQNVREWIEIVSLKFDIIDYDSLQRRRFIPQYLSGAALKWHLIHREALTEWGDYTRAIELAFPQITTTSRDMNLQLLKSRVQGPTEPFNLYYNAVVDLCRQHNPDMADVQVVDWLKAGMRLELFEKLHGDEFLTPQSLLLRTQRLELDHEVLAARQRVSFMPAASSTPRTSSGRRFVSSSKSPANSSTFTSFPTGADTTPLMDAAPVADYSYGQHSYSPHQHSFAPSQTFAPAHGNGSTTSNRQRPPIVCYSCGEPGHISPRCPYHPKA